MIGSNAPPTNRYENGSFALSFELVVMDPDTSIKRWNTIREHL